MRLSSRVNGFVRTGLSRCRDVRPIRALTPRPLRRWLAGYVWARGAPGQASAEDWLRGHVENRLRHNAPEPGRGLLSFITPVWNTTVPFLQELADSVAAQAGRQPLEWVVLDNGSTDDALIRFLDSDLARRDHVAFYRSGENLGIVAGTRFCLERARNRYVLRLDHDDRLYPDAARVVARALRLSDYPSLAYSDEDKLIEGRPSRPFFKPDWDPVLFLDQCYTAHLDVVDRRLALSLGAYTDPSCEGSPDWDCFMRFVIAGHRPMHIPEVVYSWRVHAESTAHDITSKQYVESSQRAVLGRWLRSVGNGDRFSVVKSPLFAGTPDWWMRREHVAPRPLAIVTVARDAMAGPAPALDAGDYPVESRISAPRHIVAGDLAAFIRPDMPDDGLICVAAETVVAQDAEWPWEALGVFDLHGDAVVVGGRCLDGRGRIVGAGSCFGFGRGWDSPDAGRPLADPGYGLWLWKRHSVSAMASDFAIYRAGFLRELLAFGCPPTTRIALLGPWAGAYAARTGRRVVYSPHIVVSGTFPHQDDVADDLGTAFLLANSDLIPDTRYYPRYFGLDGATNYRPVEERRRQDHIRRLLDAARQGAESRATEPT